MNAVLERFVIWISISCHIGSAFLSKKRCVKQMLLPFTAFHMCLKCQEQLAKCLIPCLFF